MTPDETRGQWIGARDAAALTGATVRALQKRAARGSIVARKVTRDGVNVWEFDARELGAKVDASKVSKVGASIGAPIPKVDAPTEQKHARNGAKVDAPNGANMDASTGKSGRVQTDDLTARLLAQLETENVFLRGVIEQLQRDGAETRAALREALKSKAPQLTAGDIAAHSGTENNAAGNDSQTEANAVKSAPDARQSGGVDYGAIKI